MLESYNIHYDLYKTFCDRYYNNDVLVLKQDMTLVLRYTMYHRGFPKEICERFKCEGLFRTPSFVETSDDEYEIGIDVSFNDKNLFEYYSDEEKSYRQEHDENLYNDYITLKKMTDTEIIERLKIENFSVADLKPADDFDLNPQIWSKDLIRIEYNNLIKIAKSFHRTVNKIMREYLIYIGCPESEANKFFSTFTYLEAESVYIENKHRYATCCNMFNYSTYKELFDDLNFETI